MKERIFKNWVTTVLGVFIICASVYSVFKVDAVEWQNASIGIGIGFSMLFIKEKRTFERIKTIFKKHE